MWYAKIIYDNEGVYICREFDSLGKANLFIDGFNAAKEISCESEDDPLEDYHTCVDQLKPK